MISELHGKWKEIYRLIGRKNVDGGEILRFSATLHSQEIESKPLSSSAALDYFKNYCEESSQKAITLSEWIAEVTRHLAFLHENKRIAAATKISHARLLAVAIKMSSSFSDDEKSKALDQWE